MSFNNLKKNDVVFSESKGSRVFKLISKKDNHWVVGDMFTKNMIQSLNQTHSELLKQKTNQNQYHC